MSRLIEEIYTDHDRLMINKFKSEGVEEYKVAVQLLHANADHRLQRSLLDSLQRRYDQAVIYLAKIPKPNLNIQPLLPLANINETLKQITESMVYTMNVRIDVQADSISDYINTQNLTDTYYELIAEKVAYGVLTMTSPYTLGMLSCHIDRLYIFHYIRDHIVKPNLYAFINKYKTDMSQKDNQQDNNIRLTTCYQLLKSFIYALLISMDSQLASKTLQELSEYASEIPRVFNDTISKSEYLIPRLIRDLFLTNSPNHLTEFLGAYSTTFTRDATLELLKQYCEQSSDFIIKFNKTYNDRVDMNPIIKVAIDGLTLAENYVVQNLIKLKPLSNEEMSLLDKSYILKNINSIINEYKSHPNVRIKIDNSELTISSDIQSEKKFAYRRKEIQEIFINPFNIFKTNRATIERLFNENDLKCPLFQSAIPENIYKRLGHDMNLTRKYTFDTVEKRVKHRQETIRQLQEELLNVNPELIQKSNNLISGQIDKIKHMNTSQRSNYVYKSTDKASILLTLSETEGLYQLATKYLNTTKMNTPEIKPTSQPQEDIQLDMLRHTLSNISTNNGTGNLNFINVRKENMF